MATTIRTNGKVKATPGVYPTIDASGLEALNNVATGIVAILGTASGGTPVASQGATSADRVIEMSGPDDFIRLTRPEQARTVFRSGDLREAAAMLFAPSNDPAVPGGAQQVICMKVNPDKQATGTMDKSGTAIINLESVDFGPHTNQIRYGLQAASSGLTGYLVTIQSEDTTETVDGLGGDAVASLVYTPSAGVTWRDVTAAIATAGTPLASTITVTGSAVFADTSADAANSWDSGEAAEVAGTSADAGKTMRVYGTTASGFGVEDILLDASGDGTSTTLFTDLKGAHLSSPAAGSLTVQSATSGTARFSFSATNQTKGGVRTRAFYVNNSTLTFTSSSGTQNVHVFGVGADGSAQRETVASGTGGVAGTDSLFQVEFLSTVDVASGETVTVTGTIAQTASTAVTTLQEAEQFFDVLTDVSNGASPTTVGFAWTNNVGDVTRALTKLDELSGLSACAANVAGSADFTADTFAIIDWINNNSQFMTAALNGTNITPPDTFTSRFLTGGLTGTATFADWQRALDLLKQDPTVSTIVPLTGSQAVHLATEAHCAFMCGEGQAERDALVGAVRIDGSGDPVSSGGVYTLATKTQLKAQAVAVNSRHVRMTGQKIQRYNTSGVLTTFDPWFTACLAAGMQAGAAIGTPLTRKYVSALSFSQDSSWNPKDDSDELIQGGLLFLENIRGVGLRWVRNITTYLKTTNLAFQEGSTNQSVNISVRQLRESLEAAIGQPGFPRTLAAARGRAVNELSRQVAEGIIAAWAALSLQLVNDVLNVSVEISPTLPINFVPTTVHLAGTNLTA